MNLQALKIIRDLRGNKARTGLVILTIAIGVFAVSSIARAWIILSTNLTDNYLAATPASATIFTTRTFNQDIVKQVAKMPEVALAEGRNGLLARVQTGPDRWRVIRLIVREDFQNLLINTVWPQPAASLPDAWPPPNDSMLLERSSLDFTNLQAGQMAMISLPNGRETQLHVVGVVHDVTQIPTVFSYVAYAYITPETYFHLTGIRDFNALDIVVAEHPDDEAHIQEVVSAVTETLKKNGYIISEKEIPEPQKHDLDNIIQSVLLLLSILAVLAVFLSAFLVVNSISALLAQQTPQIGTIKAIGGRSRGIAIMYLSSVFILGSIAFMIAVPAGILMAQTSSTFIASLINFDITNYTVTPKIFALEFFASLLIPLLAAYVPIYSGTRITVREAISQAGTSSAQFGTSGIEQLFNKMRGMPSSMLYAFRNVFRRKVRLILTLLTLSVAGAIFIATVSVRASLVLTIDQIAAYWQEDMSLRLSSDTRMQIIKPVMEDLPEVIHYEGRLIRTGFRIRPDGSESNDLVSLFGVAVPTQFIEPSLIDGRWLQPGDKNSIVINIDLLTIEPDLAVGDEVTFRLGRRETKWRIVGIVTSQVVGSGELLQSPLAYAPYDSLTETVGRAGQINQLLIETSGTSPEQQETMAVTIEKAVEAQNLRVAARLLHDDLRDSLENAFEIILSLVQLMSLLFAVVGALGLTGLMTLSVLERTREVGVIRVVGGVRRAVAQIIVTEGVFVGLLSWLLGSLLAWPLSLALTRSLGETLLQVPLIHTFPWYGLLFWLVLVIILAIFASLLPALNASKLSVRETMAYE